MTYDRFFVFVSGAECIRFIFCEEATIAWGTFRVNGSVVRGRMSCPVRHDAVYSVRFRRVAF